MRVVNFFYRTTPASLMVFPVKRWKITGSFLYSILMIPGLFIGTQVQAQDLPVGFCWLLDSIPDAVIDLKYCTGDNFMGRSVEGYHDEVAIATCQAARALKKVQKRLRKDGTGLKIYDAYRPQRAVNDFIRWSKNPSDTLRKKAYYPDWKKNQLFKEGYISTRSGHSRGSTVDLTLVDLETGRELEMGSPYDFFGIISHHGASGLEKSHLDNRNYLRQVMAQEGFVGYSKEWWHYTLANEPFPDTYFDFAIEK